MARNTDSRFRQNIQFGTTGIIGYSIGYPIFSETFLHIVTENVNASNKIVIQAKLEDATDWVNVEEINGNESRIVDIAQYDFVRFECTVFNSASLGILKGSGFFSEKYSDYRPSELRNRSEVRIVVTRTSLTAAPLIIYTVTSGKTLYITDMGVSSLNLVNAIGEWRLRDNGTILLSAVMEERTVGAPAGQLPLMSQFKSPLRVNTNLELVEVSGDINIALTLIGYEE